MERRHIETLSGRGKVFRGAEFLFEAPYSIEIWQEFPGGIRGLKEAIGSIRTDALKIFPLMRQELTLELEDGKKMGFAFKDTDGRIENTTGIQDPQGAYPSFGGDSFGGGSCTLKP